MHSQAWSPNSFLLPAFVQSFESWHAPQASGSDVQGRHAAVVPRGRWVSGRVGTAPGEAMTAQTGGPMTGRRNPKILQISYQAKHMELALKRQAAARESGLLARRLALTSDISPSASVRGGPAGA